MALGIIPNHEKYEFITEVESKINESKRDGGQASTADNEWQQLREIVTPAAAKYNITKESAKPRRNMHQGEGEAAIGLFTAHARKQAKKKEIKERRTALEEELEESTRKNQTARSWRISRSLQQLSVGPCAV